MTIGCFHYHTLIQPSSQIEFSEGTAFRTWYAFGPHLHIVKLTGKAGYLRFDANQKRETLNRLKGNWLRLPLDLCLASL